MFKDKQYTGRSMHPHPFYPHPFKQDILKETSGCHFLLIIVKDIFKQYFVNCFSHLFLKRK